MDSQQNDNLPSTTSVPSDISPAVKENKRAAVRRYGTSLSGCGEEAALPSDFFSCRGSKRPGVFPRKLELKENELVAVKVGNRGGVVEKIPKEEAICRLCFTVYKYHMLQIKCKCEYFTMIHTLCAAEWSLEEGNKCDVCGEDFQNVPITVSWDNSSSSPRVTKNRGLKTSSSTRKRFCGCFCFSL